MAEVRIIYWKEVPVQVQAVDVNVSVSIPLDDRFQQGVDALNMSNGSAGTDNNLMAWEWSGYVDVGGSEADAASGNAVR